MTKKKVLILGATGMLGHVLLDRLSRKPEYEVYATARSIKGLEGAFSPELKDKIREEVDADNFDSIVRALAAFQPEIVINCIGLIKQIWWGTDPLSAITVNAQLPHRISLVCRSAKARMIHISTDCVFDGKQGMCTEEDPSTATDIYGKTKFLGEVQYSHCFTLRTSIIGHELKGRYGLVEWFLAQQEKVNGYAKAIYSGFPTVEIARIISDYILPNETLSGVYQVSSDPISKYDLLKLITEKYEKKIEIIRSNEVNIDRSLDSTLFKKTTGYQPPDWPSLVDKMYQDYSEKQRKYKCYT